MAKLTSAQVLKANRQAAFAPKLESEAKAIAAGVDITEDGEPVEGIETVIALLIPMLLEKLCFKQTGKTPAAFLESKWNGSEYKQSTIRLARFDTRQAAKQSVHERTKRLKPPELDALTVKAFDRARLNPEASAAFATEFYASQA